ncbi:MAG: hypothetical protein H6868_02150 [Rhodospirillales bacterium]|nr:hypothetical protein [Rhodospirillales bacterium]
MEVEEKLIGQAGSVIGIISALAVYFSIVYNFGFFYAIDLSLLSFFEVSDYVTSGIAFVLPATLFFFMHQLYLALPKRKYDKEAEEKQEEERIDKELGIEIKNHIKKNGKFDKGVLIKKIKFKYNVQRFLFGALLALPLFIIWLGAAYPDLEVFVIMIFAGLIMARSFNLSVLLRAAISAFTILSIMVFCIGFVNAGLLRISEWNVTYSFSSKGEEGRETATLIRTLSKNIILLKEGKVLVFNRDDLKNVEYKDEIEKRGILVFLPLEKLRDKKE